MSEHVTYQLQYRKCGKPYCTTCRDGEGHGPYFYGYWRDETTGRLRSKYIGKTAPADYRPKFEHVIERCQCKGKRCNKCHVLLCRGNFTKDSKNKVDGLKRKCRKCANEMYAQWAYGVQESGRETRQYKKVDLATRFFSKVEKTDECWLWHGSLKKENGYGVFAVNRRNVYAHRWSYEYHKGAIPEEMEIDHLCHVRNCVNPEHLEAVDNHTNTLRSLSPSAKNAQKTHCVHGHLYTEENTIWTKRGRRCRTCQQLLNRKRYQHHPRILKMHCDKGHLLENGRCKVCAREYDARWHRNKYRGISSPKQEGIRCKRGHPYNEENTYIHPKSGKHCRLCRRERNPRYQHFFSQGERVSKERGYTLKAWRDVKAKYDYTCLCCGCKEPDITLVADHVIPRSLGGPSNIDNIQPLCKRCNSKKHVKIIDYRSAYTAARQARFEHGERP